jgi:hypothetical protein
MNEGLHLLRRALERLKLINGPDENCVIKEWKECSNHKLIHEIEDYLKDT